MKTAALKKFRHQLSAGQPVYGLWVTLESASITEMAVALGLDWVVIDAEHGHLDFGDIVQHIRAAVRSDTVVLVRIAEDNIALVKVHFQTCLAAQAEYFELQLWQNSFPWRFAGLTSSHPAHVQTTMTAAKYEWKMVNALQLTSLYRKDWWRPLHFTRWPPYRKVRIEVQQANE